MKFIENIIEKVILNKLESIDFEELILEFLGNHENEIKEAIKKLVKEAVTGLIGKVG